MDSLRFDYSPSEIEELTTAFIKATTKLYDTVGSVPLSTVTFENTVKVLEEHDLSTTNVISFLQYVSPHPEVRKASRDAEKRLEELWTDLETRDDIYQRYVAVQQKGGLDPIDQRLVDEDVDGFKRNGLSLGPMQREEYKKLRKQLDDLERKYEENIAEDESYITLCTEELAGMPDDFKKRTLNNDGLHKITHSGPDTFPILDMCDNRETRKKAYDLRNGVAPGNLAVLEQAIDVRTKIGSILGKSWCEYQIDQCMAKKPATVYSLLNELQVKLSFAHQSLQHKLIQKAGHPLKGWDRSYYSRVVMETSHCVDTKKLREYFPLEHCIREMLAMYSHLFGLRISPVKIPSWHDQVRCYSVTDSDTNDHLGYFGMDLHPRDGKYSHAAMWPVIKGRSQSGVQQPAYAALVCNFTPGTDTQTALMSRDELETLFHEFGHVVHELCGGYKARYASLSGTEVKLDFVEAPSQLIEQWLWEPKVLQRVSSHVDTGKSLDNGTISRLAGAKNFGKATHWLRQCWLSEMSLAVHSGAAVDLKDLWRKLEYKYLGYGDTPHTALASWDHLGSGQYSASYYSYTWSIIIAADLYSLFANDPFNATQGRRYRRGILEPGGSVDPREIVEGYLGRQVSTGPFLESIGITLGSKRPRQFKEY